MPKAFKPGYYAVRVGRVPGIYLSWADCEAQIKGFTGALYKKLSTETDANAFMAAKPSAARTSASHGVAPVASTTRAAIVPEPTSTGTVQAARSTPDDEGDCDIVYCDGACKGNGQTGSIAGVGVWWGHGDSRNISERCPGDQTNNRAELVAIVRILETTPRLKRRLLIKTDSSYSIQCVSSWIFKWMRNGFLAANGRPVQNRALIKYLAALLHIRRKTSQTVEFKHIRGHVGIEGNEAADQLANLGVTKLAVPERDWEKLEKEVLQALKPVKPIQEVDDDLKAYADGLLGDDELAELADTSIGNAILPVQGSRQQHSRVGENGTQAHAPAFLVPDEVAPLRINPVGSTVVVAGDGTTTVRRRPITSKEELEAFTLCLLGDDELSALGKDGGFDSDFDPVRVQSGGTRSLSDEGVASLPFVLSSGFAEWLFLLDAMSVAVVLVEDEASQPSQRARWTTRLYRVGWRLHHHATKHMGVGFVCSVAYFDPGNWVVDLQAGSQYGYSLLFTVLLAGMFASFLQVLAARLGVVTGLDFASHCRLLFHDRPQHKLLWRWGVLYPLYLLAEIAIICTDLAEMLGSAIALVILFPALPLWSTVLLTVTDVMLILAIENPLKSRPVRLFEALIAALVLATVVCIALILSKVTVDWGNTFRGFVPSKELFASGSLYTSVGIVGATIMPHSLFLGSHLATQDRLATDSEQDSPKIFEALSSHQTSFSQRMLRYIRRMFDWRRLFSISHSDETSYPPDVLTHADWENNKLYFVKSHIYHGMVDIATSLMTVAVTVNSLILILSSAIFYYNSGLYGSESPANLFDAHSLLENSIGVGAGRLFAVALLASGQSASIIATVAGQSVSEGFLRWKVSPTLRRLFTRALGLVPSVIVASVVGENGINALLVGSQVALSIILPFIIFPLVYLTSSSRIMSVKSQTESASPTQIPADFPSLHAVERARDREADSENKVVDFSSGKIVTALGYTMWLVIVAANVYVLATL